MNLLSRRALAKGFAGVFIAAVAVRVGAKWGQKLPVVSFFLDQPYLDTSGVGEPYLPPQGLRGGEALARLSELELRHITPHG